MKTVQGNMIGKGLRFAIVASRFNEFITSKLIEGAKDTLIRHAVNEDDINVFLVPGAWEQPLIVKELAMSKKYDAIIALGAVIKGETSHDIYVASEAAKGLAMVSLDQRVPVAFGILTCDNLEQAIERAGSKAGNKGTDAANAALESANVLKNIREEIK